MALTAFVLQNDIALGTQALSLFSHHHYHSSIIHHQQARNKYNETNDK
jgi:hypothetical protein